jgi:hypothetical protein
VIKEEQIVKLVTVTITDIFVENELIARKLQAVELFDDVGIVAVKFLVENSTLPKMRNPSYILGLRVADLQEWIGDGTDVDGFVEKLEFKLAEALQVKTERKK